MADVPFYMQGSQTGGILQNLQQPSQSYIPSIPGAQPQGYTPGYGQAPYAQQPQGAAALDAAIRAAAPYGQGAIQKAVDAYNIGQSYNPVTGTVSPQGAAATGLSSTNSQEQWLSPDELGAKNDALKSRLGGGGSSGGGGGGGAGAAPGAGTAAGGGLNLSGTQGGIPTGSTPGSLTQSSTPIGQTVGFQNPGSVNNTGTVGYSGPGGSNSQGQAGVLAMQPADPNAAMAAYQNTPGYQMLGNDQTAQYQQSPGYQYAVKEALNQVQQNASARGLLESGSALRGMTDRAQGMAQQDYGNWWNRQNQLYGDYQNRLQGLAGGPTGSADAMTTGANAAQANLQTGSNLGSLFGNQGTTGMGGIINTAAAQSGNMINAGQQQATVNAANQATQLAGATLASNQQNQNRGLF